MVFLSNKVIISLMERAAQIQTHQSFSLMTACQWSILHC